MAFTASVREDNGPFPGDVHQKTARAQGRLNTIVYRIRRTRSTAFVTKLRGYVVACPIDADRWVVCVRPINRDISTGSEPRGVVSGDINWTVPNEN